MIISPRSKARITVVPSLWLMASFMMVAHAATPKVPIFVDRYDYTGCATGIHAIAAADINGDGIPDLVCSSDAGVGTMLGNGDGTFRAGPTSTDGPVSAEAPLLLDLNGDGKVDLISAGYTTLTGGQFGYFVMLGNGDGNFQPGTFYPAGTDIQANYIVTGDFNGDGILDFASQTESGVWLFTGKGSALFNPGVLIPVTQGDDANEQLAAIDINKDGKLDLVVSANDGFAVLLGNGDGTFQPQMDTPVPYYLRCFALGDFNSDGKVDLFAGSNFSIYGYLFLGKGDGTFELVRQVNEGSQEPITLAAADLNGDGFLDIVTAAGEVMFGNGKGQFSSPTNIPTETGSSNQYVLPAQLRKKGVTDLVFESLYVSISVVLNQGNGKFPEGVTVPVSGGDAHCAVTADFNGDGIPDLAVGVDQGLSLLLGTGKA